MLRAKIDWPPATSTCATRPCIASSTPSILDRRRVGVYPTYDFAHGQSDAIEGITHSICTLEFQDHRPLYEWLLENLSVPSRRISTSLPGSISPTLSCRSACSFAL